MRKEPKPRTASPAPDAEAELGRFIAKFAPPQRALIRAVRAALQRRWPSAIEMAYDNYNFFVIGYSPTERPSDAVVSIAAAAKGVSVCFLQGARLADPHGLLQGSGKQTRFVRIPTPEALERPELEALLAAATAGASAAFAEGTTGRLVIKSVSAKQRPRRAS
jgi:hypothetical protein